MAELDPLNLLADRFVKLSLGIGLHNENYVDAYSGPPELKMAVEEAKPSLPDLDKEAEDLIQCVSQIHDVPTCYDKEIQALWMKRKNFFLSLLKSSRARITILQHHKLSYDEELEALYELKRPAVSFDD